MPVSIKHILPGLGLVTLIGSLAAVVALAVPARAQSAPAAKTWKVPRTPDGHPDLEGVWNNNPATPFERPSGRFLWSRSAFALAEVRPEQYFQRRKIRSILFQTPSQRRMNMKTAHRIGKR